MPRNGSGVFTPDWVNASPNTTIESAKVNSLVADLAADANAARPITAGGTGATTAATARDALGLEIGVDIPSNGQLDMADRRNRIVNGDMRVSQENGTTAGTSNGRYPVDQWAQYFVTSAGTLTVAQVASVTPAGSPNRLRATVTTADASLAAGEYWTLTQNLEGSNVADFQYGGSAAKDAVLRFGFKGPAGTYAARLGNSAANRSYVALFTIASGEANTDTVQTAAIPGDTTGTWLTADGVIGITLEIVLACGSTFQGTAGWQTGLILGTSGVTNGMATGSAVFELFDVGLRLDPDATGVYGAYEVGEVDAKFYPKRYAGWLSSGVGRASDAFNAVVQTTFPEMCKSPTFTFTSGSGALAVFGSPDQSVGSVTAFSTQTTSAILGLGSSTLTAGEIVAINAPVAFRNARLS